MLPNLSSRVRDCEPRSKVVPKKLSQIKQTKPLQLSLFELLTETDILTEDGSRQLKKGKNYSQTIELYDFMPRFVWTHQADVRRNYNGLLPALRREFECRGEAYSLTLKPAILVGRDGTSTSYYPSADEDILETILRKIYLDDNPKFFDGQPGMTFTVNQIRKELKKQGRTRSHYQILDSLQILKGSEIVCQNLDTGVKLSFNPIDVLCYTEKSEREDGDEPCYLIFSRVIAEALESLYFRRYNYQKVIGYKSHIARLLHRRLSHHFKQANENVAYTVNFSTLLRDFGLEYPTLATAIFKFKKAIEEMKKANVIQDFKTDAVVSALDSRKIEDYFLTIVPTKTFSFEMSASNTVQNNVARLADSLKEEISSKTKKKRSIFPKDSAPQTRSAPRTRKVKK